MVDLTLRVRSTLKTSEPPRRPTAAAYKHLSQRYLKRPKLAAGVSLEDRPITTDLLPPAIWEPPAPVLLNPHKHHAAFLGERIKRAVAAGPAGLAPLAGELVVIGTKLMDLYHGPFSPREIGEKVLADLKRARRDAPEAFRAWVEAEGGYRVVEFPEDTSRWVLRFAEEDRFVHVHPARYSPFTVRVRANVLTTAVMALAYVKIHGGDALDRKVVNAVRRDYLALAPVGRDPSADEGIGSVIALLR